MGLELQEFANKQGVKITVAISVITDGLDQHSKHPHSRELTFAKHALQADFDLIAIGIGIDHDKLAHSLGFKPGNCRTVDASAEGIRQATHFTSVTFVRGMTKSYWDDDGKPPPSSNSGA